MPPAEPLPDHTPIAIIGAGFAGLAMAIRLVEAGRRDFVIFDKEDEVGGTWKVNTYPGCACDVPSHLYSLSFAPHAGWSRSFSPQPEIWAYQRALAERYGLYAHLHLSTQIVQAAFDEAEGLWRLCTHRGQTFTAQVVVAGMGGLSQPSVPQLPGQDSFQGAQFHTQQWDHEYELRGKRVAVIGTGASAIQVVPQIAPQAEQLHVFQRSAPWVLPKDDYEIDVAVRARLDKYPALLKLKRWGIYWALEWKVAALVLAPALTQAVRRQSLRHMRSAISDKALVETVTPNYAPGCKRILLSNDYYPALARSNVEVVTAGIQELRKDSIITQDGQSRPVDAIIYGTGFKATDPVAPGVVFGRAGLDLVQAWAEGPKAYRGTTVAGFPNLFFILGPNTGLGHTSVLVMMEAQVDYILGALKTLEDRGASWCDVRPPAQTAYNTWLQRRMARTVWSTGGCQSWYQDARGKNVTLWPGFTVGYRRMMRRFDPEAYEWSTTPAQG